MIRMGFALLAFLVVGVTSCSVAYSQSLDFRIEGPTEVLAGEYVELRVEFPEGVQADVSFVPVEEDRFGVHPIVRETIVDGKLVPSVRGRVCTFSARCAAERPGAGSDGERDLTVVATAFASVDGVPRVHSLRHRIRVKSVAVPTPPKEPPGDGPTPPPNDDDLGPRVPLPAASSIPADDLDKIVRILDDVVDRLEALEARASAPAERLTPPAEKTSAVVAPELLAYTPPAIAIADAKPGHWSVASATNVWRPTKGEAVAHLRASHPTTARRYEPLEALSLDAILTLHDDAHEGRTTQTRPPAVSTAPQATRYVVPSGTSCPGGVCPTSPAGRSAGPSRSSYTTGPLGVFRWRR